MNEPGQQQDKHLEKMYEDAYTKLFEGLKENGIVAGRDEELTLAARIQVKAWVSEAFLDLYMRGRARAFMKDGQEYWELTDPEAVKAEAEKLRREASRPSDERMEAA